MLKKPQSVPGLVYFNKDGKAQSYMTRFIGKPFQDVDKQGKMCLITGGLAHYNRLFKRWEVLALDDPLEASNRGAAHYCDPDRVQRILLVARRCSLCGKKLNREDEEAGICPGCS